MYVGIMNRLSVVKSLEAQEIPVLSTQQIGILLGMNTESVSVLLSRLVKDGVLTRVQRGYYSLPSTDVRAIASGIYPPSFVSLMAAFEYYGTTTQSPRIIDVINPIFSGMLPISLENGKYIIRFIKTKESLIYGFRREYFNNKIGFMAEKERAVIDGLLFSRYVPLGEVVSAIRSGVNIDKVIKYAKKANKQTLMKRLGYLLSSEGVDISPEDFGITSDTYVGLEASLPKRGRYDKKWRVIVNTVIE